ncbi:DUF4352 domain-containing protein [Candidatus Parcubacteria bacterium]|nr:DUF4352 domain-containing protein [Candidatus Parcubacteria bacterium]
MEWFKKHKIITVILALLIVAGIAGAAGGGSDSPNSSGDNQQPPNNEEGNSEQATVAKIGEAARDGKFEFTVKKVECGKTEVVSPDSDALRKKAQGQYCLMTINVKNIGNEQQYFSEGDQKLLNAEGQQFSPDSTATLYNSNNSDVFLAQINPGNSVEGVLVFDIPKGQKPVSAELHDSAFSDGIKVNLQ